VLMAIVAALTAPPTANHAAPAWLEGCWVTEGGTEEHWALADQGLLFGYNVVRRNDEIVFFEQLRIEGQEGGSVFFAYPGGKGPTTFMEAARGKTSIRFENPAHDDPQVIGYERTGDDLLAFVSMIDGSNRRQWAYSVCPTDA